MFLFQFVKHIIETVIEIYEILLIWWVDPQYPWSQGIGSPIWGSSMTRVKKNPSGHPIFVCGISKNLNLKLIIDFFSSPYNSHDIV